MKSGGSPRRARANSIRSMPLFFSGRFFLVFGLVSAGLLPTYFVYPGALWMPLAVNGIILMAALVDFVIGASPKKIVVERPLPFPLAVDRSHEIQLEIANRTGQPVSLTIRDDFPEQCRAESYPVKGIVRPGSGARLAYRLTPLERGNGQFGDAHFWVLGRLGLVWKHGKTPAARTMKFYPGLALIERHRLRLSRPQGLDPIRSLVRKGVGSEFDSLREYSFGDDSRLIHWGTTARKGKPVVRVNRLERSQTVFVVLDAGRMMTARVLGRTKLDYGLDAALLLAYAALEIGDKVGLMVVGQDIQAFLAPSSGPGQFGRILDATYALAPKLEEPRFYRALSDLSAKLKRRALVVIFTDLIDERSSEGLLRYSMALIPRHLPLVVAMSDTEVVRIADGIPETMEDLYRQGVAAEMLERREKLIARLGSAGVMVLSTQPERISAAALDRYLEIKTKNRL